MKLFLTLLTIYLLVPVSAQADPVTTIVALVANGASIGAALTATLGTFGAFLVKAAVSIAFSLASQLLQPQRKVNIVGIQTEQTTTGDVTPLKFMIGRYGLEGHLVAPAYSHGGLNGKLNYILEVSNMPIEGITRVAVDGEWYEIDTDPENANEDYGMPLIDLSIYGQTAAWIKIYDGTQATADAMLVDKYGDHDKRPWTTDHILEGSAYVVMTFQYRERLFTGLPAVRFEVDGIQLYDPRKDTTVGGSGAHRWADSSTWEFTRNPQVMVYNILRGITLPTGDIWGGQIPAEDLPLDAWFAAMNACDALIGSRVTYQAGFEIDVSVEPFEIIRELNKASFTQLSQFGGVFRPRTGAPGSSVMSITDGDILITEPSDLDPFPGLDQTHNAVTGTFIDPESIYQGRACDPIYNATWEEEDGDRRLTLDVGLSAVTNKSQAQHLLNSFVNDDRRFRVHRLALPPNAAMLEPLDAIDWTSDRNGYTSKIFEVVEVEDRLDTFIQVITIRERDAGDVDWSSDDDVDDPTPFNGLSVPDDLTPTLTLSGTTVGDALGAGRRPAIQIEWPADESEGLELFSYEVRVKATSEVVSTATVRSDALVTMLGGDPLVAATTYQVRGQYTIADYPTDWSTWEDVTTPDVRLSENDFNDAVQTALLEGAQAYDDINTLTAGFSGTIAALETQIEADIDASIRAQTPLGVSIPQDPLQWSNLPYAATATLFKAPVTLGTFGTDDPDFGDYYEFDSGANRIIGQAYPVPFVPGRVYKVTYTFKVVDDGTTSGAQVRGGASVFDGLTPDAVNQQATFGTFEIADGPQTFAVYFSDDGDRIDEIEQAGEFAVELTGTGNWLYFHIRQNATTDGRIRVASIVVQDVTDTAISYGVLRQELASEIAGVNATLTTDYYTAAETDSAISAVQTTLQSSIDDNDAAIGSLSATLTADYYTSTEVDGEIGTAVSAAQTTLQSNIDDLSSTVTTQGAAITDLEGNASAGYLISVQAGSEVSLLDLVAADGSGGSVSVARLEADDILLNGTVYARHLRIGDPTNYLTGGDFENEDQIPWDISGDANIALTDITFNSGAWSLGAQPGASTISELQSGPIEVKPGDKFYLEFYEAHQPGYDADGGNSKIRIANAANGSLIAAHAYVGAGSPSGTWNKRSYTFTIPSGITAIDVQLSFDPGWTTGDIALDDFVLRRMTDGELIVEGSITAGMGIFDGPLQSSDYSAGSAGWQIDEDGSAEFNDLVVRGWIQDGAVTDKSNSFYAGPFSKSPEASFVAFGTYNLTSVGADEVMNIAISCDIKKGSGGATTQVRVFYEVRKDGAWRGEDILVAPTNASNNNAVQASSTSYVTTGEWDWSISAPYDNVRVKIEVYMAGTIGSAEYMQDLNIFWQKVKK